MSTYWYILFGLALVYYAYVFWVLKFKKRTIQKKKSKKFAYLHLNDKFVYKSDNKQTKLGAVLDQINEVENTSKLLEAFKEGSSDENSNSLTRKKHEKLKVIRNGNTADKEAPNPEN